MLHRNGLRRKTRKVFYPAPWAWDQENPFSLLRVDGKDVLDKGTLGTLIEDHFRKRRLPRYKPNLRDVLAKLERLMAQDTWN